MKYENIIFNLAWKIANPSVLRESLYKCARYVEILCTSTPLSVDFIGMCRENGINPLAPEFSLKF